MASNMDSEIRRTANSSTILAGVSLRGWRRGFSLLLRHVSPATFDRFV